MPERSTAVQTRFIWLGSCEDTHNKRGRAHAVASGSKILAEEAKAKRHRRYKNDIVNDKSPKAELRGRARVPI